MSGKIINTQDIIDSRDIIKRIEGLQRECVTEYDALNGLEKEELEILVALAEESEANVEDWEFGTTLIRASYFRTYAQEFAEDIGAISRDFQWPLGCIDWTEAVDQLQMDYVEIDFNGVTYYTR